MDTCRIIFEEQNHYIDYNAEMINDVHVVCIFPRDQKLINLIGSQFHLIRLLNSRPMGTYNYQEPLSDRAKNLKKIIAVEIGKIFKPDSNTKREK